LEVNCETDFVARSEPFLALVNSLAMQIAASPSMEYVTADEIPAAVFEAEKAVEMGREDLQSKPDAIKAKIAEGRVKKLVQVRGGAKRWMCLLGWLGNNLHVVCAWSRLVTAGTWKGLVGTVFAFVYFAFLRGMSNYQAISCKIWSGDKISWKCSD
jgi:hypothetical protein